MPYERTIGSHPYWLSTVREFLLPDLALAAIPAAARPPLLAAVEAMRQGNDEVALARVGEVIPLVPPGSPGAAFAHATRGMCQSRIGRHADSAASLEQAIAAAPGDPRLTYSLGVSLLRGRAVAEAVSLFRQAVTIKPDLGQAWAALALIYCLEQEHAAAEVAAREALRLGQPLPGRIVELALMQATRLQGKPVEGAFDFSTLALADREVEPFLRRLLVTMPPVDEASLVHPPHGRPVYFVYADHLYAIEHVVPLILSIAETHARCAIHLHVANPGRGLAAMLERLRAQLDDVPMVISTESVLVEQYAAPAIYHSCVRLARFWQTFTVNQLPMAMLDADMLARRDPTLLDSFADPTADIVLARSEFDPYWSRFLGAYLRLQPSRGAAAFLGRAAAFVLDNFAKHTARWFLDQTALAACYDRLQSEASFSFLPWGDLFGGLSFTDEQIFWLAYNEDKYGDNPHTRFKEDLRRRHGFRRVLNDEAYAPALVGESGSGLIVDAHDESIAAEVSRTKGWRKPESELLAGLVRPGHTVVDVGALFGAATVALAQAVGPHGQIHAIESDRLQFQLLAANLALAAVTNTFLLQANTAIDDLDLAACHLIRLGGQIDHSRVLANSARALARYHPIVYIADAGRLASDLLKPLHSAGYMLYSHPVDNTCTGVLALPPGCRLIVNGMQRVEFKTETAQIVRP